MDWIQFVIFMAGIVGLFFWNRSEANSDRRDILALLKGIQDEIKDFHGRLCAIEERRTKILER